MKAGIKLVEIGKLRAHEQVCPERLAEVMMIIKRQGRINNPIVVARKYLIILDGHHRVESLKRLGYRLVPVMAIDYFSKTVRVFPRRKEIKISKQVVISKVLSREIFPEKTTRHLIRRRITGIRLALDKLK